MNKLGIAVIVLAVFFLGGTLFATYTSVQSLATNEAWVAHTHDVLLCLKTIIATVTDAETGQRGFIITGDDMYLTPYQSALRRLDQELSQIKSLTQDNAAQQANVLKLNEVVSQKVDELKRTLDARRTNGFETAQAEVLTHLGKNKMDAIRAVIRDMESAENALMKERTQAVQGSLSRVYSAAFISAGTGIVLLVLSIRLISQHLAERSAREREVMEQKEWFHTTLSSIGDAVITTDVACRITFMNPIAEALTGHKLPSVVGRHVDDVFVIVNESTKLKAENPIQKVLETGMMRGLANHTALVSKMGSEVPIDDSAAPIRDSRKRLVGVVLVFRDITSRKQYETSLREAAANADRATRAKDEFLAIVSHELRTPLTAMLGWVRMIQTLNMKPEQVKHGITVIERNIKVQTQLIEDLLDISKIVAGKFNLNIRPANLESVVTAAVESVRPAADAKKIAIEMDLSPVWISADGDRLQQVVWNLLSNAIKFTAKGGKVSVRLEQTASHVRIAVADSGKGIAREFLPQLFTRFSQQDPSTTRSFGGLGLGLAIAKHLVEAHGGSIHAESGGEGQGATFTVVLPVPAFLSPLGAEPSESGAEAGLNLAGIRVLAVDDEADARDLLEAIISQYGGVAASAASASDALNIMSSFKPDILVSDIGMPGLDGYALIQRVRKMDDERLKKIPAIALTAYAREDDRRRALDSGFQAHEPKPIEPARFAALIAQMAKPR